MITKRNFKVPIYGYKINVIIFDDIKEVEKDYPEVKDSYGATMQYTDGCIVLMKNDDITLTIVHECEHIKNAIWNFIGYTPQAGNDEVDAYLITYLFARLSEVHKKHIAS